ncbi:MAG: hypothetical protein R3315_04975 [Woeseiaceae bacterium]|nr:hypothetical protein [Woeseiaceae bacterium]
MKPALFLAASWLLVAVAVAREEAGRDFFDRIEAHNYQQADDAVLGLLPDPRDPLDDLRPQWHEALRARDERIVTDWNRQP